MLKEDGFIIFIILPYILYGQWGQDTRLTFNPDSSILTSENSYCLSGQRDTIHIIWWDRRDGNWEIYYKRSTDQGMTWESDIRLTSTFGKSQNASIASLGNYVHIVWEEESTATIHYIRSTNFGSSWLPETILSLPGYHAYAPSLAIYGDLVHVIWRDYVNRHLYYSRSTDKGNTWELVIEPVASPISSEACISASESSINIVWHDFPFGTWIWHIYYLRSTNNGVTWDTVRIIHEGGYQRPIRKPRLWAKGDTIHLIWDEGDWIYYMRSIDNGNTWGSLQMLSDFGVDSRSPYILAYDSLVFAVWHGYFDDTCGIFYRWSKNAGLSWQPETTLTKSTGYTICPYISSSLNKLHLIWQDDRDGNPEIYYKHCQLMEAISERIKSNVDNRLQDRIINIYPIPGGTEIWVSYKVENRDKKIEIEVYDLNGKKIKSLVDEVKKPGNYIAIWQGKDERNSAVSSGLYFCILRTDGKFRCSKKILFLHQKGVQ